MILDPRFKKEERRDGDFFTESDLEKLVSMPDVAQRELFLRINHAVGAHATIAYGTYQIASDEFKKELMEGGSSAALKIIEWMNANNPNIEGNIKKEVKFPHDFVDFMNPQLKQLDRTARFFSVYLETREKATEKQEQEFDERFLDSLTDLRDIIYSTFAQDERRTRKLSDFMTGDLKDYIKSKIQPEERKIKVSLNGKDDFTIANQDRVDLSELVKNGIKYGKGNIHIDVEEDRSHVNVKVKSYSRKGLDLESLRVKHPAVEKPEDVFKLGVTRGDSSYGQGSGRGLYEAHQRAQRLGGALTVQDTPIDGGYETSFTRSFPLYGRRLCSLDIMTNGAYEHSDAFLEMFRGVITDIRAESNDHDHTEIDKLKALNKSLTAYHVDLYADQGGTFVDHVSTTALENRITAYANEGVNFQTSFSVETPGEYAALLDKIVKSSCDFRQRMGETRENNHIDIMEAIYHGTEQFKDIRSVTYSEINANGENKVKIVVEAAEEEGSFEKTLYNRDGVEVVRSAQALRNTEQKYLQPTG